MPIEVEVDEETNITAEPQDAEECTALDNPENEEWDVEAILGIRQRRGKLEFKVKWEGFNTLTWEPEANLTECQAKMHDFFRTSGLQCVICDFHALTPDGLRTHNRKIHPT